MIATLRVELEGCEVCEVREVREVREQANYSKHPCSSPHAHTHTNTHTHKQTLAIYCLLLMGTERGFHAGWNEKITWASTEHNKIYGRFAFELWVNENKVQAV
jgi:hypothetical protein